MSLLIFRPVRTDFVIFDGFLINIFSGMIENPIIDQLNERFEETAPHCFFYEANTENSKFISETLYSAYFPFNQIDVRSLASLSYVS